MEDRARDRGWIRRIGRGVASRPSWNINELGHLIDRGTQAGVRATGKVVTFENEPRLLGPTGYGENVVIAAATGLLAPFMNSSVPGSLTAQGRDPAARRRSGTQNGTQTRNLNAGT